MKMKMIIISATVVLLSLISSDAMGQSKADVRNAKRQEAQKLEMTKIAEMIGQQQFFFQADQISWTSNVYVNNIILNQQLYGIWIYPKAMNVSLPIYGLNETEVNAQLDRSIEYNIAHYSYKVTEGKGSIKWIVAITSVNPWDLGQYTYTLNIDEFARCSMTVTSPYSSDVEYAGHLFPL